MAGLPFVVLVVGLRALLRWQREAAERTEAAGTEPLGPCLVAPRIGAAGIP